MTMPATHSGGDDHRTPAATSATPTKRAAPAPPLGAHNAALTPPSRQRLTMAIAFVVWDATKDLWGSGTAAAVAAIVVFALGHVVAFALEALVVGVQALRLEYYELFSRIFVSEGRPFRPWHIPVSREETRC